MNDPVISAWLVGLVGVAFTWTLVELPLRAIVAAGLASSDDEPRGER